MANLNFWGKWDIIASNRGFNNVEEMMVEYSKKHTNAEMAQMLEVSIRTIELVWHRLLVGRDTLLKDKVKGRHNVHKDEDGFNKTHIKQKWLGILSGKGFNSLREAAEHYKSNGLTLDKMANDLGVGKKLLQKRLQSAGVTLPSEESIKREINPLGLL